MESSTPKPGESPKPLGEESRAEANRRFADLEASRIVDGMNRLRKQKIAAQSQEN